jgi:hypothetical protein
VKPKDDLRKPPDADPYATGVGMLMILQFSVGYFYEVFIRTGTGAHWVVR